MNKDILILGGGPAGLSTALHLHKLAPALADRVLVLEKEYYPRRKLCAGGLVIDAERILESLGLDVAEIPHVDVDKIHFDIEGRGLQLKMRNKRAMRVIRREQFDAWLAKKVEERGMEIRQGVSVTNIRPDPDGVTVETDAGKFRAEIVIGADGSNGITRRCILPSERVSTARVLEVLAPTQPSLKFKEFGGGQGRGRMHEHDVAYFEFSPVPDNVAGYVWDFPTQSNGEAMRCWGVYDTNIMADYPRPALKTPLADEMQHQGYDLAQYKLEGHPIRWYTPWNTAAVPRVLLVGDAVGADPIFGEGISFALGYGALAAREISESFRRGDFSFRAYKRRLGRSGLGRALFARWIITYIIYPMKWKWFQIIMWRFSKPLVAIVAWLFVLNWSKRLE